MNFVGHVAVAQWHDQDPAFVLGSMLPDFLGMARARVRTIGDEDVARGVRLHHETDDVFHHAPAFVEICGLAAAALETRGVRRGTARAVAHIGAELFLDGELLLTEPGLDAAYLSGLRAGRPERAGGRLSFRTEDAASRFETLQRRLEDFGVPAGYRDPGFVGDRLRGALAGRPRLAMDDDAEPSIRAYLPRLQGEVQDRVHALRQVLRDGVTPQGASTGTRG